MASTPPLKVIVFLGTVKENRLGLRVAKFIMNELQKTNHDATLFGKLPKQFQLYQVLVLLYVLLALGRFSSLYA